MLNKIFEKRLEFKKSLQERKKLFGGWVSFSHPSITEIFSQAGFDFIAIDMGCGTKIDKNCTTIPFRIAVWD